MAVVAQGRATARGDMGARPIYGIFGYGPSETMTIHPYHGYGPYHA